MLNVGCEIGGVGSEIGGVGSEIPQDSAGWVPLQACTTEKNRNCTTVPSEQLASWQLANCINNNKTFN